MKLDRHKPAVTDFDSKSPRDWIFSLLHAAFARPWPRAFERDAARYLALLFFFSAALPTSCGQAPQRSASGASSAEEQQTVSVKRRTASTESKPSGTQQQAVTLIGRVLRELVHGDAFDAKVRETVWTSGREVIGVGTYEQAGAGTGRYNLQVTMHDGEGKHRLHQISDGRLAWTRTEIADQVSLRRVDVGRLDGPIGLQPLVQALEKRRAPCPGVGVPDEGEVISPPQDL